MSLSLTTLKKPFEPFKYPKLSPRTIDFDNEKLSPLEKSLDCEEIIRVKPNMEIRKQLTKINKIQTSSDNIYLRNRRWKEKTEQKINKKKWEMHVSEMSICTFAPSLKRITEVKNSKRINLVTY